MITEDPFAGKQIWFLTGSQTLYGEDVLERVAEQSRAVASSLDASDVLPVRIEWKPVLKESDEILRVVLAAEADERCVGLIAWMHTFSPAKLWIRGLRALSKPLLQLHTQANAALPWSTIDMDFMNLNQSAHGDREFGHVLTRLGVPRKVVVGHASDPRVADRVGAWARAATADAELRGLRVTRFGDNMRRVAVTDGDKVEAEHRYGFAVDTFGVNDLVDRVDAIGETEADATAERYLELYDVDEELRPGGARHASLRYAARLEAGLRSFLAERGSNAFTTTFEDLGGLRQLPGLPVQRLMADGYGFGPEGDWKVAALVRAAKVMAYGLPGGTSLMEDYTYDLTPGEELVLGAHMLEICPTLTVQRPRLEIHSLGIGAREDPLRLVFDADPGPGIVVCLVDLGDRFRMISNQIDVVEPPHALPRLPVARAVWRPHPDFATSAGAWLIAGGSHHTVLTTALGIEAFEDLARMTDTELVAIDETTTQRRIEQELRWNTAYRRIADHR